MGPGKKREGREGGEEGEDEAVRANNWSRYTKALQPTLLASAMRTLEIAPLHLLGMAHLACCTWPVSSCCCLSSNGASLQTYQV